MAATKPKAGAKPASKAPPKKAEPAKRRSKADEELDALAKQGVKTEEGTGPTAAEKAATAGIKLPKSLGLCVDLYKELQTARLDKQKEVDAIEKREKIVKAFILESLASGAERGAVGKFYQAVSVPKSRPELEDQAKFYAHIKKTGEFELLNKALNKAAISERWEAGKTVPGVAQFTYYDLSVTKIK